MKSRPDLDNPPLGNRAFYGVQTARGSVVVIDSPREIANSVVPIDRERDIVVHGAYLADPVGATLLRAGLAGLDETGNRGAAPKYGPAEQKRILALLDRPPPDGYANWTAPLLALAGRYPRTVYLALPARPEDRPVWPRVLVHERGP